MHTRFQPGQSCPWSRPPPTVVVATTSRLRRSSRSFPCSVSARRSSRVCASSHPGMREGGNSKIVGRRPRPPATVDECDDATCAKARRNAMNVPISAWDAIGFIAACLVFGTFYMRDMTALRALALCSNLVFIVYGFGLGLAPIWLLHAFLLPVNAWRLGQDVWMRAPRSAPPHRAIDAAGFDLQTVDVSLLPSPARGCDRYRAGANSARRRQQRSAAQHVRCGSVRVLRVARDIAPDAKAARAGDTELRRAFPDALISPCGSEPVRVGAFSRAASWGDRSRR